MRRPRRGRVAQLCAVGWGKAPNLGRHGEEGVWLSIGEDREKRMPRIQSQRDQVTQGPIGRGVRGLGLTRRLWTAGKGF